MRRLVQPVRAALFALAGLASVAGAAPAAAQAFDMRSLIPEEGPRERAGKERLQREAEQKRVCDRIKVWFDEPPLNLAPGRIGPAEQNAAVLQLLDEGRFTRAFGKAYAQMSAAELNALAREVMPRCVDPKGPLNGYYHEIRSVAYAALDAQRQSSNMRQLSLSRGATRSLQVLTDELQALPVNEKGYARIAAIRQSGEAMLKSADSNTATDFEIALSNADARVAAPMQSVQVREAVAAANGYEGLAQLARLAAEMQRRSPPSVAMRENLLQIHVRMDQIGSAILDSERPRIDGLGDGLPGLEQGVRWQATFDALGRPHTATVRPLDDVQAYFALRRRAVLDSAQSEFASLALRAANETQLDALQRRYLLASDDATVTGAQLMSLIAERRHEIGASGVIAASRDMERSEPVPRATTRLEAATPLVPVAGAEAMTPAAGLAPVDLSGEPAEDVMLDLLRTRYENEVERLRRVSTRCPSGRSNDTMACGAAPSVAEAATELPLRIRGFKKRSCTSTSGRLGYVCEFEYTVTGGPSRIVASITVNLGGDDGVTTARFTPRGGDWVMITAR